MFLKTVKDELVKHSPEILTGLGIAGMFGSIIFTVQATVKATKAVENKKRELNKEKLNSREIVSVSWKYYIPTAVSFVSGAACVLGSDTITKKRTAAIAAAYSITETALTEYKEKVVDAIGEKKETDIRDRVIEDKIRENPPKSNEVIITNGGDTLFYETISGRYFKSDIEKVRRVENELNRNMRDQLEISLNDLYVMLGLPVTNRVNDDIGWEIDRGYIEFVFSAHMSENEQPCIAIDYRTLPVAFRRFA